MLWNFLWMNSENSRFPLDLKKGANSGLFVFIFVLFKHNFTEKTVRFLRDSNWDRRSRRRVHWPLDHHHSPQPEISISDMSFLRWAYDAQSKHLILCSKFKLKLTTFVALRKDTTHFGKTFQKQNFDSSTVVDLSFYFCYTLDLAIIPIVWLLYLLQAGL